jgi:hypothetical protein
MFHHTRRDLWIGQQCQWFDRKGHRHLVGQWVLVGIDRSDCFATVGIRSSPVAERRESQN